MKLPRFSTPILITTLFFANQALSLPSNEWSTPKRIAFANAASSVAIVYAKDSNKTFATWRDAHTKRPTYAYFDSNTNTWSAPKTITPEPANAGVFIAHDDEHHKIVASWVDAKTGMSLSSIYNYKDDKWSPTIAITLKPAMVDPTLTFNPGKNEIVATWPDAASGAPISGIFSHAIKSWRITPIANDPTASTIFVTHDKNKDTVLAAWKDAKSNLPLFSTLNKNTNNWNVATPIATKPISSPTVSLVCDTNNNRAFAVWLDAHNQPTFSTLNLDTMKWSQPVAITSTPAYSSSNIVLAYDSDNDNIFAAWVNNDLKPVSAIYNGETDEWSQLRPLSSANASVDHAIFLTYDDTNHQAIAAWLDSNDKPTYTTFMVAPKLGVFDKIWSQVTSD